VVVQALQSTTAAIIRGINSRTGSIGPQHSNVSAACYLARSPNTSHRVTEAESPCDPTGLLFSFVRRCYFIRVQRSGLDRAQSSITMSYDPAKLPPGFSPLSAVSEGQKFAVINVMGVVTRIWEPSKCGGGGKGKLDSISCAISGFEI
jgi:hypothetical protein